jgi:hypothetical protein
MRDLQCDPATLAGPIDPRVVGLLRGLSPAFVAHMATHHGGRPKIGTFKVGGKIGVLEQFLTLVDHKSELPPPSRPHFDDDSDDERAIDSIRYLTDGEHATSRALFGGLLPFATLRAGMCLDRAYVDLLCFDRRTQRTEPPVVLWLAHEANSAAVLWEDLSLSEQFDADERIIGVPWDDYVVPLAATYAEFVEMLRPNSRK